MSEFIIVKFKGQHTAEHVLLKLRKMNEKWDIDLEEVAVLSRDPDGRLRLRQSTDLATEGWVSGGAICSLTSLLIRCRRLSGRYDG